MTGGRGKAEAAPVRTGARPVGLCPGHPQFEMLHFREGLPIGCHALTPKAGEHAYLG